MSDIYYWVIQTIRGETIAHGPYKSEQARDNRLDKIKGGEIAPFSNFSPDPSQAIDESKGKR